MHIDPVRKLLMLKGYKVIYIRYKVIYIKFYSQP